MRAFIVTLLAVLIVVAVAPSRALAFAPQSNADVDTAFAPLQKQFRILYESLRSAGGMTTDDSQYVTDLRARVQTFRTTHPDHPAAIAMEYQLSKWLGEDDAADAVMQELLAIMPGNLDLVLPQARQYRQKNQYGKVIDLMSGFDRDVLGENAEASLLFANCLFAEHDFETAIEILGGISEEELATNSYMLSQVDQRLNSFQDHIESWSSEQAIRAAEAEANNLPRVRITMEDGSVMEAELFENEAPNTVANFISLASDGFYDGTTFHRVISNFMAQGGDPLSKPDAIGGTPGAGNPGYLIADEYGQENAREHFAGSLAMHNQSQPDTAGSQFFIAHEPLPQLNGRNTVFGRLLAGLEEARAIERQDRIATIEVLRKRDHVYQPNVLPLPGLAAPTIPPAVVPTAVPSGSPPDLDGQ